MKSLKKCIRKSYLVNKFDNFYLRVAENAALLSHAQRAKVGAVLVKDDNILAFGYNGTPTGADNTCEEYAPIIDHGDELISITKREVLHAESNALMKVARSTNSTEGATMYCTLSPCFECAKLIIQSGIKKVVYTGKYRDESPITFLLSNNVEVICNEH